MSRTISKTTFHIIAFAEKMLGKLLLLNEFMRAHSLLSNRFSRFPLRTLFVWLFEFEEVYMLKLLMQLRGNQDHTNRT